jgi:ribonuclease BN (tRNA processing enzyme)
MQLTVLGCRSGMPSDGQASSGYLVTTAGARLLLDCGPGLATKLDAVIDPADLDGVIISHFHLDHCYDLLPIGKLLLSSRMSYPGVPNHRRASIPGRTDHDPRPVPLYVPAGGKAVLDRLAALFPVITMPLLDKAFELAFDVREYEPGDRFTLGDCDVSLHPLRHAAPNCGARIEGPSGSLAYTGDTGVTRGLIPLARDVDLLLAEATLPTTDHGSHGHLSATDAGRAATDAAARQLVLTHFISTHESWLEDRRADAQAVYDGPVHLAAPAATYDVCAPNLTARVP